MYHVVMIMVVMRAVVMVTMMSMMGMGRMFWRLRIHWAKDKALCDYAADEALWSTGAGGGALA
jgi:hypothetical protein